MRLCPKAQIINIQIQIQFYVRAYQIALNFMTSLLKATKHYLVSESTFIRETPKVRLYEGINELRNSKATCIEHATLMTH